MSVAALLICRHKQGSGRNCRVSECVSPPEAHAYTTASKLHISNCLLTFCTCALFSWFAFLRSLTAWRCLAAAWSDSHSRRRGRGARDEAWGLVFEMRWSEAQSCSAKGSSSHAAAAMPHTTPHSNLPPPKLHLHPVHHPPCAWSLSPPVPLPSAPGRPSSAPSLPSSSPSCCSCSQSHSCLHWRACWAPPSRTCQTPAVCRVSVWVGVFVMGHGACVGYGCVSDTRRRRGEGVQRSK